MDNIKRRKDSCPDGSKTDKNANGRLSRSVRNSVSNRHNLLCITAIGLTMLVLAGSAFGQFTVQPMKMDIQIRPGKMVKSTLNLQSFDVNEVHTIDLSVIDLGQNEDGSWQIIEPNSGIDTSTLSSCKDWISFNPETVTLQPLQSSPVEVTLKVPPGIRGFHTGGILASIRPRPDIPTQVTVILRFLVPVLVEIEGRAPRPKVEATDVGLELIEASGSNPPITLATMSIANNGGTYSQLKPVARIWLFSGGHWRVITTTEFPEASIIPGAKLKLKTNARKPLPSGKYKVAGVLYVDGRRTKRIEKEIDFVGDPSTTRASGDAPIDLDPTEVIVESVPGATRAATIKVYNASDETVNIRTALGLPGHLQTRAFGDVKGEDLDCTGWVKITPEKFTLRGEGGQQNLRVVASMPNPTAVHPCYYSLLALWATYPDGQDAGYTTANICVRNKNIEMPPEATAMKLNLQTLGESKYFVIARFGNFGTIHFTPITVRAAAIMATGMRRADIYLSGDPSLMLPFEWRDFSGVIDLSNLPADIYGLEAALEYAPGTFATRQMAIRVSIQGDERIAEVLGQQEELDRIIEVKW